MDRGGMGGFIRPVAFAAAILSMAFASRADAAEIRVATALELNAALRSPNPGDVIVLKDGNWRDAKIRFRGEGTPDEPITLRAETIGGAKLI